MEKLEVQRAKARLECEESKMEQDIEFRAIIQYLMIDKNFFKQNDYKPALKNLVIALESLAWMHNCNSIQCQMVYLSRQ